MRSKEWRKDQEKRVYTRRAKAHPGYFQRYPNKTPGKGCSTPGCCGNPRRVGFKHKPQLTPQEQRFNAANDDIEDQIVQEEQMLEMVRNGGGNGWDVGSPPWETCTCESCWPGYYDDYYGSGYFEVVGPFNCLDEAFVVSKAA